MQAVILAAGASSRFYPFASREHKSMIRVLGKPILEHTVLGLKRSGLRDIVLVVGGNGAIRSYFGNGKNLGVSITYVVQSEPSGMGDALLRVNKYIKGDFLLLHGHHADVELFTKKLISAKKDGVEAVLIAKKRENPWEYGVLKASKNKVVDILEKPKKGREPSNLCLIGIYFFSQAFLKELSVTPTDHYQLEHAIARFAKKCTVQFLETKAEVMTLKYPWHLLNIKNYLLRTVKRSIGKASIATSVEIIGNVVVEDGATIMEGVRIKGPCYIGKNVYIGNNALLRNGVDVEAGSVVGAYMEIKNSLIMENVKTHSGFIGDSVIGQDCRIGAQFCTANVRIDRETVKVVVKNEKADTGFRSLGVMMGDKVRIGIKSSTMPGVIIGERATIGPSTVVLKNVSVGTRYYTKFQEVVEEKTPWTGK